MLWRTEEILPLAGIAPRPPSPQPVAIPTELSRVFSAVSMVKSSTDIEHEDEKGKEISKNVEINFEASDLQRCTPFSPH
jgi:hypothetical protein